MLYAKYITFLKMTFLVLKQNICPCNLYLLASFKALGLIFGRKTSYYWSDLLIFFSWVYGGKGMGVVGCLVSYLFPFLVLPSSPTLL